MEADRPAPGLTASARRARGGPWLGAAPGGRRHLPGRGLPHHNAASRAGAPGRQRQGGAGSGAGPWRGGACRSGSLGSSYLGRDLSCSRPSPPATFASGVTAAHGRTRAMGEDAPPGPLERSGTGEATASTHAPAHLLGALEETGWRGRDTDLPPGCWLRLFLLPSCRATPAGWQRPQDTASRSRSGSCEAPRFEERARGRVGRTGLQPGRESQHCEKVGVGLHLLRAASASTVLTCPLWGPVVTGPALNPLS